MRLPKEALTCLLLQRTSYSSDSVDELSETYGEEAEAYARAVGPYLPPPSAEKRLRFLDVGCGLGVGLLALSRIYGVENDFVGLDKDRIDDAIQLGYNETAWAYNSLPLTREVLAVNGLSHARVLDADVDGFPDGQFDVVVSLLAWGFHFPVQAYARLAHATMAAGGRLVLDLRKGQNGVVDLAPWFEVIHEQDERKFRRVVFVKREGA